LNSAAGATDETPKADSANTASRKRRIEVCLVHFCIALSPNSRLAPRKHRADPKWENVVTANPSKVEMNQFA
jgi:hypothetical protein